MCTKSHAHMAWLTRTSCPLSPCLSTLFKKISTPSDRHRSMTFRPPWRSVFWVYTEKLSCEIQNSLQITHKKLNMGLYGKNWLWDTHFEEIEYLESKFFAIDPYCLVFVFYPSPKVPTGKFIFYRPTKFFQKTSKPNSCYWFLHFSKAFTYLILVFKFYTCVS